MSELLTDLHLLSLTLGESSVIPETTTQEVINRVAQPLANSSSSSNSLDTFAGIFATGKEVFASIWGFIADYPYFSVPLAAMFLLGLVGMVLSFARR